MNYYDELGVAQSASAEEIRRAYKTLVRLLHPDQQQDETLRRAAERQLQRIHSIVDVLTDDERRRQYDEELAARGVQARAGVHLLAPPPGLEFPGILLSRSACIWIGASICCIVGIAFFLKDQGSAVETLGARAPEQAQLPRPPEKGNSQARTEHLPARTLRRSSTRMPDPPTAVRQIAMLPPIAPPSPVLRQLPVPPPSPTIPAAPDATAAPTSKAPPPERHLSGRWVFTPGHYAAEKVLYAPEYIELTVKGQGSSITGDYRARYRVGDKPFSPGVAFSFEGAAEKEKAEVPWSSATGSKGQIQLTLQPDNTLLINWWATQLGAKPELTSGTAVLIRLAQN